MMVTDKGKKLPGLPDPSHHHRSLAFTPAFSSGEELLGSSLHVHP